MEDSNVISFFAFTVGDSAEEIDFFLLHLYLQRLPGECRFLSNSIDHNDLLETYLF